MRAEDADRFLAELIGGSDDDLPSLTTICRSATRLLQMSGSSVVLMGEGTFPSVAGAYGVSVTVQDLEFTLGEGPASDAYAEGKPVLVGDVRSFSSLWPQFTRAVVGQGIQSIYALPLQVGAIKLGVLVLYRDGPGRLRGPGAGCRAPGRRSRRQPGPRHAGGRRVGDPWPGASRSTTTAPWCTRPRG